MSGENSEIDFNYHFHPNWSPAGWSGGPWFLMSDPGYPPSDDYWVSALRYRGEKIAHVRRQLQGVGRGAPLRNVIRRGWRGARDDRERHERLIHLVQQMMIHPPHEQPLEA